MFSCAEGRSDQGLVTQRRPNASCCEIANPFSEAILRDDFDQNTLSELAPLAAVGVGLALDGGDR